MTILILSVVFGFCHCLSGLAWENEKCCLKNYQTIMLALLEVLILLGLMAEQWQCRRG